MKIRTEIQAKTIQAFNRALEAQMDSIYTNDVQLSKEVSEETEHLYAFTSNLVAFDARSIAFVLEGPQIAATLIALESYCMAVGSDTHARKLFDTICDRVNAS